MILLALGIGMPVNAKQITFTKKGGTHYCMSGQDTLVVQTALKEHYILSIAPYKGDKACAISYTFDDGLAEQYSLVAPQFERKSERIFIRTIVPSLPIQESCPALLCILITIRKKRLRRLLFRTG